VGGGGGGVGGGKKGSNTRTGPCFANSDLFFKQSAFPPAIESCNGKRGSLPSELKKKKKTLERIQVKTSWSAALRGQDSSGTEKQKGNTQARS